MIHPSSLTLSTVEAQVLAAVASRAHWTAFTVWRGSDRQFDLSVEGLMRPRGARLSDAPVEFIVWLPRAILTTLAAGDVTFLDHALLEDEDTTPEMILTRVDRTWARVL